MDTQKVSHIETDAAGVPLEIKHWNWGAFAFNIWWGIGNKTYLPLLNLIPLFNLVWIFVTAVKGNEWAWTSNALKPEDLEWFKKTQESWNRAGLVSFIVGIVLVALWLFLIIGVGVSLWGIHSN